MRREVTLVALGLVLASLPVTALPTPPPGPYVPHDTIAILRNSEFTAANGVVGGSGSAADPYVISGWSFSTTGTAILITNVTANFTIRHNSFSAGVGVHYYSSAAVGLVQNNQFIVQGTGVLVANADATIIDNSFIGNSYQAATGRGVVLVTSNSRVESNAFLYLKFGVHADRGSPRIVCNDIHDDVFLAGVYVQFTTNATIECNIITQCTLGIKVHSTIGTIVANNSVTACFAGVDVYLSKDVTITNNTIRASLRTQLRLEVVSGNVTGNVIIDGRADAMIVIASPIFAANNTIDNNVGVGIYVSGASPDLHANVVVRSSVGIQLAAGAIAHISANVMINNTVGIDIPYESRQTVVHLDANFVNNVNIDGTIYASQQVYFYKAANVSIVGQVRDSGFSAGFYGSITAQGTVVLYEVDNANIEATLMAHANVGVTAVNSFNVVIEGSAILNTRVGVNATAISLPVQVPACAVSVKNTTINITVDPVLTIGVDAHGCLVNVRNSTISIVDTGIRFDSQSWGNISGNLVTETLIGLDISGRPTFVSLWANVISSNRIGVRFHGGAFVVSNNRLEANSVAGIQLQSGTTLTFRNNVVTANARGVVDLGPCQGVPTISSSLCGALVAENNAFIGNDGDGVRLNGTSTFRGDVFTGNGRAGARLASATVVGVTASDNGEDGVRITGNFIVRGSTFARNVMHGLAVTGSGDIRDSVMDDNDQAGLRATAIYVTSRNLTITNNFDGILFDEVVATPGQPDPLDVHRSRILNNERDGIRAGAAVVNATHNYWGGGAPVISIADQVGAFQNGVSPSVRFLPWYTDAAMTTTGPMAGL